LHTPNFLWLSGLEILGSVGLLYDGKDYLTRTQKQYDLTIKKSQHANVDTGITGLILTGVLSSLPDSA